MKKNARHQHHVGTSKSSLRPKPYGFCCEVKDQDTRLDTKNDEDQLFSRYNLTEGGPDIKFRLQEVNNASASPQRVNQKSVYRSGFRGRPRGRQKGGYDDLPRNGQQKGYRSGQRIERDRSESDKNNKGFHEPMICRHCRGPLKWYLEDEIAVAREIMMQDRQEQYNTEMEQNIKTAKKRKKRKKRRKKVES
ncbi:uncharacterized protein LOC116431124 [Nomia melanderi]|uniref:uncharacterized protein LOC116431124 n=1 Tax=Nomia melanderi TaxID=2448451 RepID=UPI003FCE978A